MLVKELIAELQKQDQEQIVVAHVVIMDDRPGERFVIDVICFNKEKADNYAINCAKENIFNSFDVEECEVI